MSLRWNYQEYVRELDEIIQGKDGSTKTRSRRGALSFNWTMQHKILRLKVAICSGETGDDLDAARTVASVSSLHAVTLETCGLLTTTYTPHTPSLSKSTDMTLISSLTRRKEWLYRRRTGSRSNMLCNTPDSTEIRRRKQGEYCRDGLHPVSPGARKRWPNWHRAGRSWPHPDLMGSFSPWPQPCRGVPEIWGKDSRLWGKGEYPRFPPPTMSLHGTLTKCKLGENSGEVEKGRMRMQKQMPNRTFDGEHSESWQQTATKAPRAPLLDPLLEKPRRVQGGRHTQLNC